ncbi:hypothetical protein IC582_021922 [Cucumis melo]
MEERSFFPTTKIVGTLGPNSRSVQVISACLTAGMSGMVGFLSNSPFVKTLENLKMAVKSTKKLCAVMLNTAGPEMLVVTKVLKKGDTLFLGQYLFTGSETSVWLEVMEHIGSDLQIFFHYEVGCVVKNSATLVGTMYTLHAAEIHIDLPTLTEKDRVFLFQKTALYRCNMAGKPTVLTRVVDSMTNNLRPTVQ